jgi:hypothetical protein
MGIAMSAQAQEMDSRSFVKQYSQKEGFTVTTLNKAALRFVTLLAKVSAPKDDVSFLSNASDIQILELSAPQHIASLEKEFLGFCETGQYEQLLETEEAGSTERIFCKFQGEGISGFIIWSKQDDSAEMVCLNGRFTPDDMAKIQSKDRKSILSF